jgi:hypothetical protein
VQSFPFDESALPAVEAELGVSATVAPYRVREQAVYELRVPCAALPGATLLVVLWLPLARVDVRLLAMHSPSRLERSEGPAGPPTDGGQAVPAAELAEPIVALTRKGVERVEIYPGVEVMFRRAGGGVLFVTRRGAAGLSD